MKKILLVTGRKACDSVRKYAGSTNVQVCAIDVAALLTPKQILVELSKKKMRGYSMVIVPGSVRGDVSVIEKKLGVPCFKGTRHSADITVLLAQLDGISLSTVKPADDVIQSKIEENIRKELEKAYSPGREHTIKIGRKNPVYAGGAYPQRIIAEIPDAPLLSDEELAGKAKYYVNSGADIVDVGMISGADYSRDLEHIIDVLRSEVNVPLSVDTLNEKEILAACDSKIDFIMSLDERNLHLAESIDVPAAVIPRDKKGRVVGDRARFLGDMIKKLDDIGFKKVVADPLLEPLQNGFAGSLKNYGDFRNNNPATPLLMGVGNVTELLDADSPGVNAVLAGFASELGVEFLFTTEASPKTRGCVRELSQAARMMYLAKKRSQPPKDLGLDLLKLKEKRILEPVADPHEDKIDFIEVETAAPQMEETSFRIYVKNERINVIQYVGETPTQGFAGSDAESLYKTICSKKKISCEHAAYLGRELAKAEIALKVGKNYVQDEELFTQT